MVFFVACILEQKAQNPITSTSNSLDKEVKEVYLIELFKNAEIISATQEKLDTTNLFIKKTKIKFIDSTFFFTAIIYSAPCTVNQYLFNVCEAVYIVLNDGGIGANIDIETIKSLLDFKKIIDDIINSK